MAGIDIRNVRDVGFVKATGLLPDFYASAVTAIKPELLRHLKVRYLVLDVDHTLAVYNATELEPATISFLKSLLDDGVVERIYIASNSRRDLRKMAASIGAEVVRPGSLQRKPAKAYYARLLKVIGCRPQEAMMVGDKLVNDIWGGNRVGMYTVLVEPIGPEILFDRLLGRRYWGNRYLRKRRPDAA